ncbi:MAG: COG4315 family predicted lipoprotein, partial [Solirubrobacteraceae bacterium]
MGWNRARSGLTGLAAFIGLVLLVAACGGGSGSGAMSSAPVGSSGPARPVTIGTTHAQQGTYLTGASGRALYMWVGDSDGASNCSGDCATAWPPLLGNGRPTSGSGVNSSALGTIVRSDGREQVSYDGHPLYYSAADPGPGTTHSEGSDSFGARWWLVAPSGKVITTKGGSAAAPPVGY